MANRKEFSRKVRRQAIERAGGECENKACGAVLKIGEAEVDHILPCELGGEPVLTNAQVLCKPCHKAKTATDVRRVRKSDRQRDKDSGAIKPKQAIQSSGFARKERVPKPSLPPRKIYQEKAND
jgi:5-methylcytosine-specific restriction enzyme A